MSGGMLFSCRVECGLNSFEVVTYTVVEDVLCKIKQLGGVANFLAKFIDGCAVQDALVDAQAGE